MRWDTGLEAHHTIEHLKGPGGHVHSIHQHVQEWQAVKTEVRGTIAHTDAQRASSPDFAVDTHTHTHTHTPATCIFHVLQELALISFGQ